MFPLQHRRLRNMIEILMIHGIDKAKIDEDGRTRKHSICIKIRRHVNSNIGLNIFARRVINY